MKILRNLALAATLTAATPAYATCYEQAGREYTINPDLLRAIAFVESSWNNGAINQNANGSEDVCLMQINSFWIKHLARYGVTRERLINDPCLCVRTGAYVLAGEISRVGQTWLAVGQYHRGPSGPRSKKIAYAERVRQVYLRLRALHRVQESLAANPK
jgi:soluble lytic murein transglycosylase-like protein